MVALVVHDAVDLGLAVREEACVDLGAALRDKLVRGHVDGLVCHPAVLSEASILPSATEAPDERLVARSVQSRPGNPWSARSDPGVV